MKNLSYFALLLLMVTALHACKKDNHTETINTADKLYPIKLDVSNITQQTGPISKTTAIASILPQDPKVNPLKGGINTIDYMLYDANGILKKHLTFHSDSAGFGSISDNVSGGNYTVAIVGSIDSSGRFDVNAGEDGFYRFLNVKDSLFRYANYTGFTNIPDENQWYDAFFKKISITVSSSGINQNVTLSRIVGQVELNLLDALPNDATSVEFTITGDKGYYSALKDMPATQPAQYPTGTSTTISNINRQNFKTRATVINTTSPLTATITIHGSGGGLIVTKTINNILCQKNTKTILSGKLFSNGAGSNKDSFQINVKTGFDGDINSSF